MLHRDHPEGAPAGPEALHAKAAEATALLRLLANRQRLLLLCRLAAEGEMAVGPLAAALKLSQPALSQHLALLRRGRVVETRRSGQAILYRLADPRAARLMALLRDLCGPHPPRT